MVTSPEEKSNAVLLAVGELLGREVALDDLLRTLVDRIAASMNADRGTLYLVDAARGELFSKAAHLPELKEIRLKLGQGIAGHVAQTGERVNVTHTSRELRFFNEIDRKTGYKSRSVLAVPMRDHRGRIIGVVQVLNKKGGPFSRQDEQVLDELASQAAMALEATTLYHELRRAEQDPATRVSYRYNRIIGESEAMNAVYRLTQKAAGTNATVLLRGESGTGKEVIARAIQVNGPRRDRPFIKVDCAALPAGLIENELFGHEKGAFTGAGQRTPGKFEAAHGGTVFIDEVGELPLAVQGKLLRVLQDREFERVGGTETVKVDVRIIAATNRNLEKLVEEGKFRADLYYRIRVVEIQLPSLRARGEIDIRRLVGHFAVAAARRHGREVPQLSESALARLISYPWPGNVRELENCIESAVVLCDEGLIQLEDLPLPTRAPQLPAGGSQLASGLEPLPGAHTGAGPAHGGPAHPGPAHGGPAHAGPAHAGPAHAGPDYSNSAYTGPQATSPSAPQGGAVRTQNIHDATPLTLAEVERRHILWVLEQSHDNRTVAARTLGIGRNTLVRKLREFGLGD